MITWDACKVCVCVCIYLYLYYVAYTGILGHLPTPQNSATSRLSDVHWSAGAMGYFPTYSLGAMYACQIYEAALLELPSLESDIALLNYFLQL